MVSHALTMSRLFQMEVAPQDACQYYGPQGSLIRPRTGIAAAGGAIRVVIFLDFFVDAHFAHDCSHEQRVQMLHCAVAS